jgi:two-component system, LytTR family, sensor kinase
MEKIATSWKRHLRDLIIVLGVGFGVTPTMNDLDSVIHSFWNILLYNTIIGMGLWKGNEFVTSLVQHWYPWRINRSRTYLLMWAGIVLYSLLFVFLFNFLWAVFMNHIPAYEFMKYYKFTILIEFLISIGIAGIIYTSVFFKNWKNLLQENAEMEKANIESKLAALQNQVNPHFLFNCLNTLNSLVYVDAGKASRFIGDLSKVYRYVLEQDDVVTLAKEVEFCQSYLVLEQFRFGEKLKVDFNLSGSEAVKILRMGLQLMLENAIKHNEISNEKPLHIEVDREGDFVVVKNNLQMKTTLPASAKMGQHNLQERYRLMGEPEPEYFAKEGYYIARIPLFRTEEKQLL